MWKMLYHTVSRLYTVWQRCYFVQLYYVCPPAHLRVTWPWLSTGHLLLDLYHVQFSQDLHMNHVPFTGRSHRKSTQIRVFSVKEVYSIRGPYLWCMPPIHLLSTFKHMCPWLLTGHLLLHLYHAISTLYTNEITHSSTYHHTLCRKTVSWLPNNWRRQVETRVETESTSHRTRRRTNKGPTTTITQVPKSPT